MEKKKAGNSYNTFKWSNFARNVSIQRPLLDYLCYVMILAMSVFLILAVFGPNASRFVPVPGLKRIHHKEGGVYADCSRPENKNNPYCRPKQTPAEDRWRDLTRSNGKPMPFRLTEPTR
jgi:hypothetical protein